MDAVRLDVGLEAGADADAIIAVLDPATVSGAEKVTGLPAITIEVAAAAADAAIAKLQGTTGVRYAERGAMVTANSSDAIGSALSFSDIPPAWTWTTGSPDITIAVIDTGVTATADLGTDRLVPGYDFVDRDENTADGGSHGTRVANVIAADHDNDLGGAGACPDCRIMPVRVLSESPISYAKPQGTTANVAAGIVWAADHGARIINVSASTPAASRLLEDAVRHADEKGSLVVASFGEAQTEARPPATSVVRMYPAAFETVLAVAPSFNRNQYVQDDMWVDVAAYDSAQVLGPDGKLTYTSGSSVSTAVVSGSAALALALKPDATAAQLREKIASTAAPRTLPSPPVLKTTALLFGFGATDTVPPVLTSTGLTEGQLVPRDYGLTFVPVKSDDHGIKSLSVLVDGQPGRLTQDGNDNPDDYHLLAPEGANGPISVVVRIEDFGGNVVESAPVILTADTIAPPGRIVSPAYDQVVHGDSVEVTIEAPDADTLRVGHSIHEEDAFTRVPGTNLWQKTIKPMDHGGFTSVVLDRAGNVTLLQGRVRFDDEPPAGGTISPSYGQRFRGNFTSTLSGVTDLGGVAKAELWANGRYMGADTTAPYALTVRPGTYSGNVMLTWRVTDRFGLWRNVPNRLVVADNRVPTVSISKAPKNKAKVRGTVKVYVKASDASGISRVELIVNGKVVSRDYRAGYVLSVNTKKQKKTMKVQIRAYDRVGNVRYTTTRTWYRR
ncbi:S8 family serine peptidase [Actinoplanes sp. NPDC051861]|uniref:S8 family serine peptidase n=1 Tax=Actinoplanes sp. NPDC051861 TaxID=3155170 RepID=UPI003445EDFD